MQPSMSPEEILSQTAQNNGRDFAAGNMPTLSPQGGGGGGGGGQRPPADIPMIGDDRRQPPPPPQDEGEDEMGPMDVPQDDEEDDDTDSIESRMDVRKLGIDRNTRESLTHKLIRWLKGPVIFLVLCAIVLSPQMRALGTKLPYIGKNTYLVIMFLCLCIVILHTILVHVM